MTASISPIHQTSVLDAEMALLGAFLHNNRTVFDVGKLKAEDFADLENQRIYAAILLDLAAGRQSDMLTVVERLGDANGLLAYLGELVRHSPGPANAAAYADMVRRASRKRRLEGHLQVARERLLSTDAQEVVTSLLGELAALEVTDGDSGTIAQAEQAALDEIHESVRLVQAGEVVGLKTPFPTLNRQLGGGLRGARLYVLAALPGSFKSVIAGQIAEMAAGEANVPVGLIDMEMGLTRLGMRSLSRRLRVDQTSLETPSHFLPSSIRDVKPAQWPIYINDQVHQLPGVVAQIREWHYKYKIKLAIVDHIQEITVPGVRGDETKAMNQVAKQLKQLTLELDMPILALSQANRELEKRDRAPRKSDLSDSKRIESSADVVVFHHNPKLPNDMEQKHRWRIFVCKNRGGPSGGSFPTQPNGAMSQVNEEHSVS